MTGDLLHRASEIVCEIGREDRATVDMPLTTAAVREALRAVHSVADEHELAILRIAYLTGFGDMEILRVAVRRAEALQEAS